MTTLPAPAAPFPRALLARRFTRDAIIALGINLLCAVVITLILGNFRHWYENLTFSMCIGTIAFAIIDAARLLLWDPQTRLKKRMIPFIGVVLATAPLANYAGSVLACLLLGYPLPKLDRFLSSDQNSMVMFTLLAACGGILLFINREQVSRIKAEAAEEKARAEAIARQALQAQLQLLQAQIEPHMLFNTLANLQGLIALDAERAGHMLDQLIRYLRATLSSSRAEATTLAQEFALIDAYLGLMSVRMGARLGYSLELPDDLKAARLPPMLLQPLVENAIIHGLEPKIDGGRVTVGAVLRGDTLEVSVGDTGLGLGAPVARAGTRVGIANTRERLRALYGERASLSLEPATPYGAVARLTLPLDIA
jgi:hypothetical protein